MNLSFSPETSEKAFAVLVSNGVPARFVRRGVDADVIAVPASQAARVRRLLNELGE
jgi:hypothetical protein